MGIKTNDKLRERIEELEKRVRDLEARPIFQPVYIPQPYPVYPAPYTPPTYPWYTTTCGEGIGALPLTYGDQPNVSTTGQFSLS